MLLDAFRRLLSAALTLPPTKWSVVPECFGLFWYFTSFAEGLGILFDHEHHPDIY